MASKMSIHEKIRMNNLQYYFPRNFSLKELTATQTGIDNTPSITQTIHLIHLAIHLQVVRNIVNQPLVITSGFRSYEVNKAVGGSSTSSHLDGLAADIAVTKELAQRIIEVFNAYELPYDQLIYYPHKNILHVGLGLQRREQILINNGKNIKLATDDLSTVN